MTTVYAYCGKVMAEDEREPTTAISHGISRACVAEMEKEMDREPDEDDE
mgnify:CR=1 FL=1